MMPYVTTKNVMNVEDEGEQRKRSSGSRGDLKLTRDLLCDV